MRLTIPARLGSRALQQPALIAAIVVALLVGSLWTFRNGRLTTLDDLATSLRGGTGQWYHVYFTRPHPNEEPSDRIGGLDDVIIQDLQHAQREVVIACYDINLRSVTNALKTAKQRGVSVRLVVDGDNLEQPLSAWMLGELQRAGIPITFDRRRAFMHNKFVVVDARVVWTGSANLTTNDIFRNNNNMLRIASPALAANYRAKFESLFAGQGGPGHPVTLPYPQLAFGTTTVENAFAPDAPITTKVVASIHAARKRIDILAFTFTAPPIAQAIVAAQRRGVIIRGVFETRNARAAVSALTQLKQAGADIQLDGNCYNMHDKVLVIDDKLVITGSFNWTGAAQRTNDENVLMITDRGLAQQYTREFDRIYAQALHPDRCS